MAYSALVHLDFSSQLGNFFCWHKVSKQSVCFQAPAPCFITGCRSSLLWLAPDYISHFIRTGDRSAVCDELLVVWRSGFRCWGKFLHFRSKLCHHVFFLNLLFCKQNASKPDSSFKLNTGLTGLAPVLHFYTEQSMKRSITLQSYSGLIWLFQTNVELPGFRISTKKQNFDDAGRDLELSHLSDNLIGHN